MKVYTHILVAQGADGNLENLSQMLLCFHPDFILVKKFPMMKGVGFRIVYPKMAWLPIIHPMLCLHKTAFYCI